MKKKSRILYLNYTSILTQGILLSQVVIPLKKLASEGYRITLVSGERAEDLRKRRQREALHKDLEKAGVELVFFKKTLPPYLRIETGKIGPSPLRALCFFYDQVRFFFLTGWLLLTRRCRILHTRSYVPAIIGLFYRAVFGIRLIFDPRGILPEELRLARGWSRRDPRYRLWKWIERILLKRADAVFALSKPFREHLRRIVPRDDIRITPCCIEASRFTYDPQRRSTTRAKLGFGKRFILVYSIGCFVPYQVLEKALEVFHYLREERPDAQLLILTPEPQAMRRYATEYSLDLTGVTITRVPFSRIPDYVSACDAGLLVRHPSIVSRVASPVKFAEYLGCGLPVLAFCGIGDTEEIIHRYSVGECVDPKDTQGIRKGIRRLLSRIEGYGDALRAQCRDVAVKYLSWDSYLPLYRAVYRHPRRKK